MSPINLVVSEGISCARPPMPPIKLEPNFLILSQSYQEESDSLSDFPAEETFAPDNSVTSFFLALKVSQMVPQHYLEV